MILDGHYTHASDVWAFAILAWELYTSYQNGQDERQLSVPYPGLYNDEVSISATACQVKPFCSLNVPLQETTSTIHLQVILEFKKREAYSSKND